MENDRELIDDALQYLNDLRGAGVFEVDEMAQSLQSAFFICSWEAFVILQEWIKIYYIRGNNVKGSDETS